MKRHVRWNPRGVVLAGLVGVGVAVMIAGGAAQQQAPQGAAGGGRGNFANNFVGKVTVNDASDMRTSRIRFEAGARTNWHIHEKGQLLLIEEGKGRWYEQGGQVQDIVAGQPIYTKPNTLHWHGAAPDSAALQFSVYAGKLDWKTPVSDDEYTGKKK